MIAVLVGLLYWCCSASDLGYFERVQAFMRTKTEVGRVHAWIVGIAFWLSVAQCVLKVVLEEKYGLHALFVFWPPLLIMCVLAIFLVPKIGVQNIYLFWLICYVCMMVGLGISGVRTVEYCLENSNLAAFLRDLHSILDPFVDRIDFIAAMAMMLLSIAVMLFAITGAVLFGFMNWNKISSGNEITPFVSSIRYENAVKSMENGNYKKALAKFEKLDDYLDSEALALQCADEQYGAQYDEAVALIGEGRYEEALNVLKKVKYSEYKDTAEMMEFCADAIQALRHEEQEAEQAEKERQAAQLAVEQDEKKAEEERKAAKQAEKETADSEVPVTPDEPEPAPEPVPAAVESVVMQISSESVKSIVDSKASGAVWAYAVQDVENGAITGSDRMEESLSSSALLDIPVLYAVAIMNHEGNLDLNTQVRINRATMGRSLLAGKVGQSLSIAELLQYMLQYSDNTASNTLMEYLSFQRINEICAARGYGSVSLNNYILSTTDYTENDNYVSCVDLCGMLTELYTDQFNGIGSRFLQENMVIQDAAARSGLGKYAPASASFMNLNGQKTDKYNEVAILDDNAGHAYVVAFMGSRANMDSLAAAAQSGGQYIYEMLGI